MCSCVVALLRLLAGAYCVPQYLLAVTADRRPDCLLAPYRSLGTRRTQVLSLALFFHSLGALHLVAAKAQCNVRHVIICAGSSQVRSDRYNHSQSLFVSRLKPWTARRGRGGWLCRSMLGVAPPGEGVLRLWFVLTCPRFGSS